MSVRIRTPWFVDRVLRILNPQLNPLAGPRTLKPETDGGKLHTPWVGIAPSILGITHHGEAYPLEVAPALMITACAHKHLGTRDVALGAILDHLVLGDGFLAIERRSDTSLCASLAQIAAHLDPVLLRKLTLAE